MSEKAITIWDNPKWRVLFEVTRLDRVKAWEVKLAEIIRAFVEELKRIGFIDLVPCGVALYSAAVIHRIKSEKLLKADTVSPPKEKPQLYIPPPLELALPPEFVIVTIEELASSLLKVINKSVSRGEAIFSPVQDYSLPNLEDYLVKLEERIEEFIQTLRDIFREHEILELRALILGVDRIEAVRRFILLLLAAARGVVDIIQEEETGRIVVRWIGGQER